MFLRPCILFCVASGVVNVIKVYLPKGDIAGSLNSDHRVDVV